jgi:sulfur-carrier protein
MNEMTLVHLHYWAGARAAAGAEHEEFSASSVADALAQARALHGDPRFDRVLAVCSVLVDGVVVRPADLDRALTGNVQAEILPPFAGGQS